MIVVVAVIAVVSAWILFYPHAAASTPDLIVGSQRITLEIVVTPAARVHGLSGRVSLPVDHGMLFVFSSPGIYSFWMNEMRFPLDILWISQGIVVDEATLSVPTSTIDGIPTHTPEVLADTVLELNAGMAEKLGLTIGSPIHIQ